MKTLRLWCALFSALALAAGSWRAAEQNPAAQTPTPAEKSTPEPNAASELTESGSQATANATEPAEAEQTNTAGEAELRQLIQQFREQRSEYLAVREQLRERLRNATEEERRAILQAFAQEHREQIAAQRELRREFRRQHMEIRRQRRHRGGDADGARN